MGRDALRLRRTQARRGGDEEAIIEHCRQSLARFKAPRQVIFGPLPKTSTGKIQKYILREEAKKRFGHFSGFTD